MKLTAISLLMACGLSITANAFQAGASPRPASREVAITVDDLPAVTVSRAEDKAGGILVLTSKLLPALRRQKISAVGFVNESELYIRWGEVDDRIKALRMWLDAGQELGNHTFSHVSLDEVGLSAFEDDVIQGETVTRLLLSERKKKLQYFRHPYLQTGKDKETKRKLDEFLAARGYRTAPVTVDASDWMFARVYGDAKIRRDSTQMRHVVKAYISHMNDVFAFSEKLSRDVLGYEAKQVLLLHANSLNADHLNDLAEMIRLRGYRFITLEEALNDKAYSLPDFYATGVSWIHRWDTRNYPDWKDPAIPAFVVERFQAIEHAH